MWGVGPAAVRAQTSGRMISLLQHDFETPSSKARRGQDTKVMWKKSEVWRPLSLCFVSWHQLNGLKLKQQQKTSISFKISCAVFVLLLFPGIVVENLRVHRFHISLKMEFTSLQLFSLLLFPVLLPLNSSIKSHYWAHVFSICSTFSFLGTTFMKQYPKGN